MSRAGASSMPPAPVPPAPVPPARARPRLVATDLDGTLLRPDGTVSDRTKRAVMGLSAAGIGFVIVTARPPRWLHALADLVGPHGAAVCANGAFVYDVPARTVREVHGIPDDLVTDLVGELRAAVPGVRFGAERASGALLEPGYPGTDLDRRAEAIHVAPMQERGSEPVGKLLAVAPHWEEADFLARVEAVVGERAHLAYSGAHGLAEITGPGVTKAAGLARWAGARGIGSADVWAFGDMPNDLPMLAWAGQGFAIAQGHHLLLRAGFARTEGPQDEAVGRTILRLLG